MTLTEAERFIKRRNEHGEEYMNNSTKRLKRLPARKQTMFVKNLQKIKTDPTVDKHFKERKVELISKKAFVNLKKKTDGSNAMFGSLKFSMNL